MNPEGQIRQALDEIYREEDTRIDPRFLELESAILEPEDWGEKE